MKGETKLSRRKIAQRNETSKTTSVLLGVLLVVIVILVARAHFLRRELIPGLVITPPEGESGGLFSVNSVSSTSSASLGTASPLPADSLAVKGVTSTNTNFSVSAVPPTAPISAVTSTGSNLRGSRSTVGRPRIAFAITITKDGSFQDGAAVLAYSIISNSKNRDYDISLLAFVHPNVTTSRPVLKKLGYHVIEAPTPINTSAIKYDFLREKIDKNGCCGATELIKINSYRLMQYDRVVHLDADTIIINPIDNLFRLPYSLIYTTDPNMATYKAPECMPVQGGFIVLQPNNQDYLNIMNIMMTTEFRKGKGWNASKIGWFWGGMTVQGVLPYYYNKVTAPNRSLILDRCLYNTMADTDSCTVQTLEEIKSAHFTVCQKPWMCYRAFVNDLCGQLHKRWFQLRLEAESFFGLNPIQKPCPNGHGSYVHMDLETARMPALANLLPDDSPDFLAPIGNTGYIGTEYH